MYTCVASSASGESSWSGRLTVRGTRGAPFFPLMSHLCAPQTTPGVPQHLKFNHVFPVCVPEYGGSSTSRASEFIQLPGPPQKPVMTEVTKSTVTLTWQSNPHEGGAAVTSYIIEAFR